jgi:hypothetical protein
MAPQRQPRPGSAGYAGSTRHLPATPQR